MVSEIRNGVDMKKNLLGLALALSALLGGCAGTGPTTFIHPAFDFGYVEKVAVIPFENLSDDQGAGAQATRYFLTSLLAAEAFEVVEPGEVARALEQFSLVRTAELTEEQVLALGRELGVQAVFLGSLSESSTVRSGSGTTYVTAVVARLVETDTGATIWSAAHTEDNRGFWSSLLGTGRKSQSEVMRRCVDQCLRTLIR